MNPVSVSSTERLLRDCVSRAQSRIEFWVEFIRDFQVERMVEVGVYQGDFAAEVLKQCGGVRKYYMIDPWKHLPDWNKPANQDDRTFEEFFEAAKAKTDFAAAQRVILRGRTTEVVDQISDGELDFAYIDGDHTLRGIAIDLIRVYPKVRVGGFVGGDDFSRTMWAHRTNFEPTLVFPYAVYFAEAVGATIYALPNIQYCLHKTDRREFAFVDLTGQYRELGIGNQVEPRRLLKLYLGEQYPRLLKAVRKVRSLFE